jgi:lysozyme
MYRCAACLVLVACVAGEESDSDADRDDLAGERSDDASPRTCATGTTIRGIDVSYHQGAIDWNLVKNDGVDFAFIRVSDGAGFHDPKFETNWTDSQAAGVIRGAYQFFRPAQDIDEQAQLMITSLTAFSPGDLPPVLDVEVTGDLPAETIAARARDWVDKVHRATGTNPIIYTGKYFWRDEVGSPPEFSPHPLWIAQYTKLCPTLPMPWTSWTFWQQTDKGTVAGISGAVDGDQFNGTLDELRALAGGG